MRYLIKNGSIIDPSQRVATIGDVLIEDGKVVQIYDMTQLAMEPLPVMEDLEVINARGCVVAPGFTDLHTHLREPGEEHKETIASAVLAAARGGFTTLCAMPDTNPAQDNAAAVRSLRQISKRTSPIQIEVIGAITMNREGKQLTEYAELVEAGCIAFSDADRSVADPAIMRHALSYAAMLGVPIMSHCEETRLNKGWAMHEGAVSMRLGLPGSPSAAEEVQVARDIALAELTGAHLHISHISTAGSVALVRAAKARGVHVTAEVTPHHLTLSDQWVLGSLAPEPKEEVESKAGKRGRRKDQGLGLNSWLNPRLLLPYDPSTRVNPPLRSESDVAALIEGLRDGTIDAIATDHSPHALADKEVEYGQAACGISGLETALGLVLTLVHRGEMDLVEMVARLTEGPASVLGRSPASLRSGSRADIVIFDPERPWKVDPNTFASQGRNTPLQGQQLKGQVMLTMAGGKIVYRRGAFGKGTGALHSPTRIDGIFREEEN